MPTRWHPDKVASASTCTDCRYQKVSSTAAGIAVEKGQLIVRGATGAASIAAARTVASPLAFPGSTRRDGPVLGSCQKWLPSLDSEALDLGSPHFVAAPQTARVRRRIQNQVGELQGAYKASGEYDPPCQATSKRPFAADERSATGWFHELHSKDSPARALFGARPGSKKLLTVRSV